MLYSVFVSASHQTGLDIVIDLKVDYSGVLREGENRARAEARALLDYAGYRPT